MEIIVMNKSVAPGIIKLVTRHQDEELIWEISLNTLQDQFDIFAEINAYWQQLPVHIQQNIFEVYKDIYTCFNSYWSADELTFHLRPKIALLFNYHKQEDIKYWVETRSNLLVPTSIHKEFDTNVDTTWTREKTYLESDYRKLVPLSISLRTMIPIWELFIARTKKDAGPFRDYQAFQLLASSNVFNCDAMNRLIVFVEHTIPKDHSLDSAILAGISSEDFPSWVLSSTVVRNLTRADIRGYNSDLTLITSLHNSITQKAKTFDSYGSIKGKHAASSNYGDENNRSFMEGFGIKEEIAAGDIGIITQYIKRTVDIINGKLPLTERCLIGRLSSNPEFINTVRTIYNSSQVLKTEILHDSQVLLASWVLSKYIPVRSIPYLNKSEVIAVIAIAAATMWDRGHYELAGLVCAISKYNSEDDVSNSISDHKTRMPREDMAELEKRYPFTRRTSIRSRAKNAKHINEPIDFIDKSFIEDVSYQYWMLSLPDDLVNVVNGNSKIRRFLVPQDIRSKMAKLMIELEDDVEIDIVNV